MRRHEARRRWGVLALLLVTLGFASSACGGATGLVIRIESDYQVPDEVDSLFIEVSGGGKAPETYPIPLTAPFPHSLAVATEGLEGTLQVKIEALKGADTVTSAQISADLVPNRMLEYAVSL